MSEGSGAARELDLGESFGDVVVKANGAQVRINADGSVHGLPAAANDIAAKAKTAIEIGDEMEDGTILAGYYEGKPLYTTPRDEPLTVKFKEAATQAGALSMTNALGHHDWRVPSKGELNVLWENRNKGKLKGTFNETGPSTMSATGWYWSDGGWAQRFRDGDQDYSIWDDDLSLRCVRR